MAEESKTALAARLDEAKRMHRILQKMETLVGQRVADLAQRWNDQEERLKNLMEDYVGLPEAAKMLNYHPQTVRGLVRTGMLTGIKRGNRWYFHKDIIKEYSDQLNSIPSTGMDPEVR